MPNFPRWYMACVWRLNTNRMCVRLAYVCTWHLRVNATRSRSNLARAMRAWHAAFVRMLLAFACMWHAHACGGRTCVAQACKWHMRAHGTYVGACECRVLALKPGTCDTHAECGIRAQALGNRMKVARACCAWHMCGKINAKSACECHSLALMPGTCNTIACGGRTCIAQAFAWRYSILGAPPSRRSADPDANIQKNFKC